MTTRPTDEEIRTWAARHDLQGSLTDLRCAFEDAATLCAERQAARDGVTTDDLHQLAFEHGDTDDAGTGYNFSMEQFDAFASAARQSLAQPVRVPEGWPEAYAAFVGAFDTARARLADNSEYAKDARRRLRDFNEAMLSTSPQPQQAVSDGEWEGFQAAVGRWMDQCFIPSLYSNMVERGDRLLEEVLELLQSHGYDKSRVATLVEYVFNRPIGNPAQEVGGVMITLAGYCYIAGLDMHIEGNRELFRIMQPEVMAKIRAKQEAKNALHFDTPLPGNTSAAPAYNGKKEG